MRDLLACLRAMRLSPRAVIIAALAGIATAAAALALAGLSAWLITEAWTMPPVLALAVAVTAVRALGITRGGMRYVERLASHRLALDGLTELRTALYSRLAAAEPAVALRMRDGDLLQRTGSDVDEVGDVLVRALLPAAVAVATGAAAVVWLGLVHLPGAVVLAACLALAGVAAPWLTARAAGARAAAESAERIAFADHAGAVLDHAAELAVAGRLDGVRRAAVEAEDRRRAAIDRAARTTAVADAATPLAVGIAAVAALLLAVPLSRHADVTTIGVLILLPLSAFETVAPLADAARQLLRSTEAASRLAPLLHSPEARPRGDLPAPSEPDLYLVRDPRDIEVPWCGRLFVGGASGAGKTTLLLALAGLDARGGEVTVDGRPASEYADPTAAVALFREDAHVFATSVAENCRVAAGSATDEQIAAALARVGLAAWLAGLPDGIATLLPDGSASLSGGQRRRLLLARALLSPAPVVLLDEPTEHLDRADADALLADIADPAGMFTGRTVVIAGHSAPPGLPVVML
ncbi:thiol reductant ABC exporter subunit CydC [Tsukamurella sp. 8F]|uniref:thiol reductant ABC exporter subunit CydC n=1 Tax=unclassified Tsukamurella TaxID=2633480 RepID=UPI0023B8B49A|nr:MULTISPECIES: thiol reductant ABC exporter subunit CydC [unclassified Tsukamurella]MDF0528424.1 thiol reductant ABC exporter subunit CydC [Tsukamurella sp. 8J]MDF0586249.1 thiol reductant ABC exporter subunit CydC [Tsukamurella sp. 8F]